MVIKPGQMLADILRFHFDRLIVTPNSGSRPQMVQPLARKSDKSAHKLVHKVGTA
jgi:hypothetical protein